MTRIDFRRPSLLAAMGLGALISACAPTPPPSPEVQAEQHRFQMGCQPQDLQGYEKNSPYCGGGNRP